MISLRHRVAELKVRLSLLLDTWYYMKEYAEPEIWNRYCILFGDIESRLAEKETELNRIESQLDRLSTSFKVDSVVNDKIYSKSVKTLLIEEEEEESKGSKIFKELVKILHPDVCKQKDLTRNYWHLVKDAYDKNDIERLITYKEIIKTTESHTSGSSLELQLKTLEKRVEEYQSKIERLKQIEPFVFESQLSDNRWVDNKRNRILHQILLTDIRITQKQRMLDTLSYKSQVL